MKKHLLVSLSVKFKNVRIGENLGIRYIKSYLNANGYSVDIIENQFENYNNVELINIMQNYDVIGFSINYSAQINVFREILSQLDVKDKLVYLGGHFATICSEQLLKDFSKIKFIICSDGELPTLELAKSNFAFENVCNTTYINSDNKIIKNPIILVDSLDSLPFPYRNKNSYYMGDNHFSLISSRGCYHRCSYCSVGAYTENFLNNKIRLRTAKNIYDELNFLYFELGINYFTFQDDLFIGTDNKSKQRAIELAKLIINSKMKIFFSIQCSVKAVEFDIFNLLYKAGLRNVMIGIENFSVHALECFSKMQTLSDAENAVKILRTIGIPVSYGFIMFYPEIQKKEILENIKTLYKLKLINTRSISSTLQIYVGTPYCRRTCDAVIYEKSNYEINYSFIDEQIRRFIFECKSFAHKCSKIENLLNRLQFKSYTEQIIDSNIVQCYYDDFRKLLYSFSINAYEKYFLNCINFVDLEYQIELLYNNVEYYFDNYKKLNNSQKQD